MARLVWDTSKALNPVGTAPSAPGDGLSIASFAGPGSMPPRLWRLKIKGAAAGAFTGVMTIYVYDGVDWGVPADSDSNGQLQNGDPLDSSKNASLVWFFTLTNLGAYEKIAIVHSADAGAPAWTGALCSTVEALV